MYQKINISIADKVAASKNMVPDADPAQSVPNAVDGSPGDSAITNPDLNGINNAGPQIAQKQTEALTATDTQARRGALPGDIQYERPGDAEFPTEQDPRVVTPTPKKRGFMESLIDAQVNSYMQSAVNTPPPQTVDNRTSVEDPDIQKAPSNKRVERPNTPHWSPSNISVDDRGTPSQDALDASGAGGKNLPKYTGKQYTPIQYKAPKLQMPRPPKFGA